LAAVKISAAMTATAPRIAYDTSQLSLDEFT
jgi:hypothetical protein